MVFSWQCTANTSRLPFFKIPLFAFQEAWKHFFSYWFCPLLLNKSCILLNFLCGQHSCPLFIFVCISSSMCSLEHVLNQGHWRVFRSDGSHQNKGLCDSLKDVGFLFHAEIRWSVTRSYQLILRHYFNKCLWQTRSEVQSLLQVSLCLLFSWHNLYK